MFRAYAYLTDTSNNKSFRITTESTDTVEMADHLLELMTGLPNCSGGGTEQFVHGIGWVLADTETIETIETINRSGIFTN